MRPPSPALPSGNWAEPPAPARCPVSRQLRRACLVVGTGHRAPTGSSEPLYSLPDLTRRFYRALLERPRAGRPANGSVTERAAGVPRVAPGAGPTAVQPGEELTRQRLSHRLCSLYGRQRNCGEGDLSEDRKGGLRCSEAVPTAFHEADLFSTWSFF